MLVVEGAARGSALNKESRIGKKLIEIPQGVKYTLDGLHFTVTVSFAFLPALPGLSDTLLALKGPLVQGPKGELKRTFPDGVKIAEVSPATHAHVPLHEICCLLAVQSCDPSCLILGGLQIQHLMLPYPAACKQGIIHADIEGIAVSHV